MIPSRVHGSVLNRLGTVPSVAVQLDQQVSMDYNTRRKIYNKLYLTYANNLEPYLYTNERQPYTARI